MIETPTNDIFLEIGRSSQYAAMIMKMYYHAGKSALKLIQYMLRLRQERLLSESDFQNFIAFMKVTKGNYEINTIPLDVRGFTKTEKEDLLNQLNRMENLNGEELKESLTHFKESLNQYKDNIDNEYVDKINSLIDDLKNNELAINKVDSTRNEVKDYLKNHQNEKLENNLNDFKKENLNDLKNTINEFRENVEKLPEVDLEKQLDEIKNSLKDRNITFCMINKGTEDFPILSVAIDKKDKEKYIEFFHNHQLKQLTGGKHRIEAIKALTDKKASFVSIPEKSVKDFTEILDKQNINYAIAPDNNLNDGVRQLLVPNDELNNLSIFYNQYKNSLLQKGEKIDDMKVMTQDEYDKTAERTTDEAINEIRKNDKDVNKACEKYENAHIDNLKEKENLVNNMDTKIRSSEVYDCKKFIDNKNYTHIFIAESLIQDKSDTIMKKFHDPSSRNKMFVSRVPGTFGKNAEYLFIPKNQVFKEPGTKRYIAFIDKNKDLNVYLSNENTFGKSKVYNNEMILNAYAKPEEFHITPETLKKLEMSPTEKKALELERKLLGVDQGIDKEVDNTIEMTNHIPDVNEINEVNEIIEDIPTLNN